ncbi:MAG: alpha/beta fold hydrolase [Actinomycetales bacterium]
MADFGDELRGLAAMWGGRDIFLPDQTIPGRARVHAVDFGGPTGKGASGPPVLLVHGLAGSHLHWVKVGPLLARRRRVVALDLPGFGLSQDQGLDVWGLGGAVTEVADALLDEPALVAGSSMGALVAVLAAHQAPTTVQGLILVGPSLPSGASLPEPRVAMDFSAFAVPGLGEWLVGVRRARPTRAQITDFNRLCLNDPGLADPDVDAATARLLTYRDHARHDRAFLLAARSMLALLRRRAELDRITGQLSQPVLVVQGERDRLVKPAAARRAVDRHSGWRLATIPGAGHLPQLELPEQFAAAVEGWISTTYGT